VIPPDPCGDPSRVTPGPGEEQRHAAERCPRLEAFEKLKKMIIEAEDDVRKAEGGNKAAGTRARQTMQDIKNAAQEVREKILELRDAGQSS